MSTLNITEDPYNAEGDGSTDDTQAIQNAIDDATDGDTVYFPATNDYYRVTQSSSSESLLIDSRHANYAWAMEGDGANSKIQFDDSDDPTSVFRLDVDDADPDKFDLTIRNLVLDGGGRRWLMWINGNSQSPNHSLHWEDVRFQNGERAIRSSFGSGYDGFSTHTATRIDAINMSSHCFSLDSAQNHDAVSTPSDIKNRFKSVYCENTGSESRGKMTFNISGTFAIEDLHSTGGNRTNKLSNDNVYLYLKNATFTDYNWVDSSKTEGIWWTTAGGSSSVGEDYTVEFDTVAFRNFPEDGIGGLNNTALGDFNQTGTFKNTGPIEFDNVGEWCIRTETPDTTTDDYGTVYVQNVDGSSYYDVLESTDDGEGVVDTLEYENVTGRDFADSGWTVANGPTQTTVSALDTPEAGDVGAFTEESTVDSTPETYSTDFSDTDFTEWTARRSSSQSDWSFQSLSDNTHGSASAVLHAAQTGPHALSWDQPAEPVDVDIIALTRVPSDDDAANSWMRLYARTDDVSDTSAWCSFYLADGQERMRIRTNDGGNISDLGSVAVDTTAVSSATGTWIWRRFEVSGSTWRVRAWELGDDEPTEWDIEETDVTVSGSGYVGAGGYSTDDQQWDYFAVGVSGDSPEVPDLSNANGEKDKPTLFEDWTPQWDSDRSDWGVVSGTAFEGERALAFEHDVVTQGRYAISCDTLGEPSDTELLDRFHVPAFADGERPGLHARTYLRSSGSVGNENGYWVEVENRSESFRLGKYSNGNVVTLGRFGTPREDTMYYRRFRADGDALKAKAWPTSENEPSGWDIEVTDPEHTAGWSGLGSYGSELVETDVFSVATGGDSASFADAPSSPTVSWANPTNGETVSGTVTVQIDATGPVDGDSNLDVAYRLGGGSWSSASYNPDTGHYEDTWDTVSSGEGNYTLEARATNSAGTTVDAAIDITVEESFSIATADARDVSNPSATLVGELTSLNSISSVTCGFEWRESGSVSWNTTEKQTISSIGEFSDGISGLDGGTEYEFRAVAYEPEQLDAQTRAFYVESSLDEEIEPVIEQFDIQDRSNPVWTRFDVDWTVSHDGGDLDTVVTKLRYEGSTVDAESTSITGETASYSHLMRVRGPVDEIVLSVNDTENRVTTERKSL